MGWLEEVRGRIEIVREKVYMDNAGAGPLSSDVREAVEWLISTWSSEGEPWGEGLDHLLEVKRLFARLVSCRPDEVAAVPGVTYGLNSLLSSLRIRRGSNAVAAETNFPTTVYTLHAMRRRGIIREVRLARPVDGGVPLEEFERLIDDNTSIVLVDHVSWITGYMAPLRELARMAHERGAYVITDAFHSVGVVPVDVKGLGVDALVTGSYKWLMGLHGAGFVYVSGDLLDSLEPSYSGWMAVEDSVLRRHARGEPLFGRPFDLSGIEYPRDASMLEWGTWPLIAFESLRASIGMLLSYDAPGRYASHTGRIVEYIMEGLGELGLDVITPRDSHGPIVTFRHPDPGGLAKFLRLRGVIVSPRPGRVRVSPHFYNTREEAETLLGYLEEYERARGI